MVKIYKDIFFRKYRVYLSQLRPYFPVIKNLFFVSMVLCLAIYNCVKNLEVTQLKNQVQDYQNSIETLTRQVDAIQAELARKNAAAQNNLELTSSDVTPFVKYFCVTVAITTAAAGIGFMIWWLIQGNYDVVTSAVSKVSKGLSYVIENQNSLYLESKSQHDLETQNLKDVIDQLNHTTDAIESTTKNLQNLTKNHTENIEYLEKAVESTDSYLRTSIGLLTATVQTLYCKVNVLATMLGCEPDSISSTLDAISGSGTLDTLDTLDSSSNGSDSSVSSNGSDSSVSSNENDSSVSSNATTEPFSLDTSRKMS